MTRARRAIVLGSFIWLPIVLIVAWWVSSSTSTVVFFPPLSKILDRLQELWIFDHTLSDLLPSLANLAAGYTFAVVVGVLIGAILWRFRSVAVATHPIIYFLYVLPSPALLPVFLLIFGLGSGMKIAIIFLTCLWPVLLNTIDGMRSTDSIKLDVAKTLQLGKFQTLRMVVFPAASPQVAAGMRSSLAFGIVIMIVSEMVAATQGIGYFILLSQQTFATVNMWTGILVLAVVGSVLNLLFVVGEKRVLRWHFQARRLNNTP